MGLQRFVADRQPVSSSIQKLRVTWLLGLWALICHPSAVFALISPPCFRLVDTWTPSWLFYFTPLRLNSGLEHPQAHFDPLGDMGVVFVRNAHAHRAPSSTSALEAMRLRSNDSTPIPIQRKRV